MKKLLGILGLGLGLMVTQVHANPAPVLIDHAVVLVNATEYCSGTFVGSQTILTAKHCVAGLSVGAPVQISQPPGSYHCLGHLAKIGQSDWAEVSGCGSSVWYQIKSQPLIGTWPGVHMTGYPFTLGGQSQAQISGDILAVAEVNGSEQELVTASVIQGYSGSAVIDSRNQVVGVTSWSVVGSYAFKGGAVLTDPAMIPSPTYRVLLPLGE